VSDQQPLLDQLDIVVRDIDAAVGFYRGARYAFIEDPDGNHVGLGGHA
jgi:predicted enzyme related to lactoylglutathione lyase